MSRGVLTGIAAYTLWGLLPLYWKLLDHVPAMEILGHRIVWSLVLCLLLLGLLRRWQWLASLASDRSVLINLALASALLSLNWALYIWAVNSGHVVETSLGYFINPLVSVLLGVVVLHERLRRVQLLAVLLAASGVLYLALFLGEPPWIALSLAISFGIYGLLKKRATLPAIEGLCVETAFVLPLASAYLLWLWSQGQSVSHSIDWGSAALLVGAGAATGTPLLLFADAARRIPLTLLGLLQFISPSMQFVLGVFVFEEAFAPRQLVGFGLIWTGLAVFALESSLRSAPELIERG